MGGLEFGNRMAGAEVRQVPLIQVHAMRAIADQALEGSSMQLTKSLSRPDAQRS